MWQHRITTSSVIDCEKHMKDGKGNRVMKGKKIMLATVVMAMTAQPVMAFGAESFTDLAGFDWAKPAIEQMAAQEILSGVGNQKYAPSANVTVAEFASMAMRAYGGKDAVITLADEQGNLEEIEKRMGNIGAMQPFVRHRSLG